MILRHVKSHEFYQTSSHPRYTWSVMLYLECGHIQRRKSSAWGGARVRCRECESMTTGERAIFLEANA